MREVLKRVSSLSFTALAMSSVYAAGYKMEFQSPSVLADGGDAAVVEDASTNWYNSAGLVDLPLQAVFAATEVYAPTNFQGSVTAPSTLSTLPPPFNLLGSNFSAQGGASSHPNSTIPAIHYVVPLWHNMLAFGLSFVPAWGFIQDYGQSSILRYNLTRVYTKTLDISPSIALRLSKHFSLGVGPDFHYFYVSSASHVRTQGTAPFGTAGDSTARFAVNQWNYGGHIGILYRFNNASRIGLNYRTQMLMTLHGDSDFMLYQTALYQSHNFNLNILLPPITSLSVYHEINANWAVMGTLEYDQWNTIRVYNGRHFRQPPTETNPTGFVNVVQWQKMENTVDLSVGAHYRVNEKLMLRGSLKYQQTPTTTQYRYVNFPDGPKLGVNIGARYTLNKKIAFDFIYAHVFVRRVGIHDVNALSGAVADGKQSTRVDLVGAQVVWSV